MHSRQHGFSLIEIIVVMALFAVIASLGLLMSFESYRGATFRSERDTMVEVLQKARSRAMANIDQAAWGVHYAGSPNFTYTVFRGASYTAGAADNEVVAGNKGVRITPSPLLDVVFGQLSGKPDVVFDATIVENGRTTDVEVNHEGTVIW